MPEKPSHGLHYYVLPDDPVAALNILREAAGWSRCPTRTILQQVSEWQ